jgi:hypothetical protein
LLKSQWKRKITHRFYSEKDFPLLENLLYEAIFQPESAEPLPLDIIKPPERTKKREIMQIAKLNFHICIESCTFAKKIL